MSQNEDLRKIADGVVNFCGEMRVYLEDTKESFDKVLTRHYQANHTPYAVMTFEDEAHYWEETLAEAINRVEHPDYEALEPKGQAMLVRRTYVIIRGNLKSGNTIRFDVAKFNQLYINGERYTGDYTFNGETPETYERLVIVAVQTPFNLGIKDYGNLDVLSEDFPVENAEIFVNIGKYSNLQPNIDELLITDTAESLYVRGSWAWHCTECSLVKTISVSNGFTIANGSTFNVPALINFFIPNSAIVPPGVNNVAYAISKIDISNCGEITNSAFYYSNLRGHLYLQTNGNIGTYAFANSPRIISLCIDNMVTSVGANSFQYCSSLRNVHIGEGVTSLGNNAFVSCPVESLHLGKSIVASSTSAFSDCSYLNKLTVSKGYHCQYTYLTYSPTLDWRCFLEVLENCAVNDEDGRTATTMSFKVASAVRTALTNAYNEGDETALAIYDLMESKSISITT